MPTKKGKTTKVRGNIEDRNETVLATTKTGYSVELYKTKNTNQELNDVIWYENNIKVNVSPTLSPSISYTKTMLDTAEGQMLSVKNNNSERNR